MKKRIGSLLLSLALCLSLLPMSALATDTAVTEVSTEDALKAAVASGGSIKLTNDITLNNMLIVASTVTLDLNGYGLTLSSNEGFPVILVGNYDEPEDYEDYEEKPGHLTLKDSNPNGNPTYWQSSTKSAWTKTDANTADAKIVKGGYITGGSGWEDGYAGGGVYVFVGSFTMDGGTIIGNSVEYIGGGVFVRAGTSFTMNGGSITGNYSESTSNGGGGGVYVSDGDEDYSLSEGGFTMKDGTISGNTADGYGGGVCVNGSFTMENGSITGNTTNGTNGWGGGVCVNGGSFTMQNGSITGNTTNGTNSWGGGVCVNGGSFTMQNGSISGNTTNGSNGYGGGVCVNGGTFTMESGSISGNTTTGSNDTDANANAYGGGVCVNGGSFTMQNGSISGNTTTDNYGYGGGVYVNGGSFAMQNGSINGNNAKSTAGGGVYVHEGTFTVSGGAKVKENYQGGTKDTTSGLYTGGTVSNVYLLVNKAITIGSALTGGKNSIGVTVASTLNTGSSVQIAAPASSDSGTYVLTQTDRKAFFPDVGTNTAHISLNEDNNILNLTDGAAPHEHDEWSYTVSGSDTEKVLTVTCVNKTDTCTLEDKIVAKYTLTAPTETLTYDGQDHTASLIRDVKLPESDPDFDSALKNVSISYTRDGRTDTDCKNAGEYTASITLGGQTASVSYTVAKATPTGSANAIVTYGAEVKDSDIQSSMSVAGSFTWNSDVTSYGNAAAKTLNATFTPNDKANYNTVNDVSVRVTVNKADLSSPSTPPMIYHRNTETGTHQVDFSVTLPEDRGTTSYSLESYTDTDGILSSSASVDSTTGQLTYTLSGMAAVGQSVCIPVVAQMENYNDVTVEFTVTLVDRDVPTVSVNDITVTYTGSPVPASAITGTATFGGQTVAGTWSFLNDVQYTTVADSTQNAVVVFKPTDSSQYSSVETTLAVTITQATPTGAPKYTAITTSGKTLADANLTTTGGTFNTSGTVQWVDAEDTALAETTEVTANTAYAWLFTPADTANYTTLRGSVTLWSQSSGGGGGGSSSTSTTVTVPVSSDTGSVNVKAEVSKGTATVEVSDKQIENVIADGAGEVTLDVSELKNVTSATVPSHVVEKTNEAENTGLTVSLPTGSVTLDETALESVTETANGEDVTVSVVAIPTSALPPVVKDIIGMEPTVAAVVDVNVLVNGQKQSSFNGGKVTISIPYTPKKDEDTSKLTVWYITDSGKIENKGGYYDAEKKCFVFETEHLSQYLLVNTNELVSFTDVPEDAYYAEAVNWAVRNGITTGMTETTFGPDLSCTRAQIVTFLWRAAGQPEPVGTENPFTDVTESDYFYNAVLWAVENGITTGMTETTFAPDATCTRAQAAAFIYRNEQANGGGFTGSWMFQLPFTDVPEWCYEAVAWCYMNGVTQGTSEATFSPNDDCTRAQIVTMLYRAEP